MSSMAMRIPSNAAPGFHPAPRPLCPVGSLPALAEEYGQYQGEDSAAGAAPHPGGDRVAGAQYAIQRRAVAEQVEHALHPASIRVVFKVDDITLWGRCQSQTEPYPAPHNFNLYFSVSNST